MMAQVGANGPACFAYLEGKYNSTSLPAAVKNLGAIVQWPVIAPDQIAGVVALNKRFSRLCFTDEQLTALILLKLPDKYSVVKTLVLQSDNLPTVADLMNMLQVETDFAPDGDRAVFSTIGGQQQQGFCFNCDTVGHTIRFCPKPKVDCGECGDKGHIMPKHCWVRNDKPLPSYFTDDKKRRIEDKRIAYKATTAAAMTITAGECCADVEEMIREDESFLDAMQRLGH
jgi:hypothetical protein